MKKAFTMIELVFVIVVVGIITSIALPRFQRDNLNEVADQVVNHIRYTQHLAMQDDKFNPSEQYWYRQRWQIQFNRNITAGTTCSTTINNAWTYSIYSDKPGPSSDSGTGNPDIKEVAKNPQNPKQLLSGGFNNSICVDSSENAARLNATPQMRLGEKYDIKDIDFSSSCSLGSGANKSKRVAFDYMGRPLRGAFQRYNSPYHSATRLIRQRCIISLCLSTCATATNDEKIQIAIEPETGYTHIL